jgi:hypothetical protein
MINRWKHWRTCGYLAASLVTVPQPSAAQFPVSQFSAALPETAPQGDSIIYVARRGWHVDIGFAAADLQPPLKSLLDEFPGVQYLFFGFGDRHYLLAKNRSAPVLLAALWPGRGLVLATGLAAPPALAFGVSNVAALAVTMRQASDAQAFVWYSLDRQTGDAAVKSYARGPYEGSLFFAAAPKYSAFHTCNTWAAESLAVAALPIHSSGVIFAGQLWARVRRVEKMQAEMAPQTAGAPQTTLPPKTSPTASSPPRLARGPAQRQGGLLPSSQTTVVPEL